MQEQLAEAARSRVGHRPDQAALVADQRAGQAQLAGEPQRRRHHPAGDRARPRRRAPWPPGPPPRVRGPMSWSSPISVPSISSAIRRIGNSGAGDRRRAAAHATRPAEHRRARQTREVRLDPAGPARQSLAGQRDDRLALVRADLQERDPVRREAVGQRVEQAPDHRQPVGSAIERLPRLEGRRRRQRGHRIGADVREVRGHDVPRRRRTTTAAGGRPSRTSPDRRRRARRRSRARDRGRRPTRRRPRSRPRPRARAGRAGRRPGRSRWRHSPFRRRRRAAARSIPPPARAVSRAMTSASARSTTCSVSGRGMSARLSTASAMPWNSLIPRM